MIIGNLYKSLGLGTSKIVKCIEIDKYNYPDRNELFLGQCLLSENENDIGKIKLFWSNLYKPLEDERI